MGTRELRTLAQAALALFVVVGAASSDSPGVVVAACTALALLATAVLGRPGWPLLAPALAAGGAVTGLCFGSADNVGWFALCVLTGWCVLRGGTRTAAAFTTCVVAVLVAQAIFVDPESSWVSWIAGTLFTLVVTLMSRRQSELIAQLRQAQAGLAERTRAEERNRVARELHDVMAHSITVSLLHVSSARLALEEDPVAAAQALEQAEELGRRSLTEVRQAVGLLRDGSGTRAPLPGAGQLCDLVEGFRRAGAQVAYDVEGDPGGLPATTGLTVYRILQESLTNAVRHGTGRTAVRLRVGDGSAVLTVDSAGTPGSPGPDGGGLRGMRERAEALGGELSAGPTGSPAPVGSAESGLPGTGWRVRAVLPS